MPNIAASFRSSRGRLVSRGALGTAALLAAAALISACGSSSSSTTAPKTDLDTTRVARSIAQSILTERHLRAKVVCPAVVVQEVGKTFECLATTANPKHPTVTTKTPFVVTIQSSKGYVTYVGK
jgi:hypothetical protein